MSRSYKHTPIAKSGSRVNKRQANKIARKRLKDVDFDIGNGRNFKSLVNSWDICDYKCYCPDDTKIYRK